jgi:hypothetical protein
MTAEKHNRIITAKLYKYFTVYLTEDIEGELEGLVNLHMLV